MKNMKRWVLSGSVVIIAAALTMGCSPQAPAPAPSPAAPAPAPAAKVTKLNMIDWYSPAHWTGAGIAEFLKRVKERTGGRLEINLLDAKAAGLKWADILPGLKDGSLHMSNMAGFYMSGQEKAFGVTWVPALIENTAEMAVARPVIKRLFQSYLDQWDTTLLTFTSLDDQVPGGKKPITKIADFKGLRLRPTGAEAAKLATALGASPVTVPVTEVYMSAEKGLVDGLLGMGVDSYRGLSFFEVFKHITDFSINAGDQLILISNKHFDSLPADVKVILLEEAARFEAFNWVRAREVVAVGKKFLKDKGIKFETPSEQLKSEVRRQANVIAEEWAKEGGANAAEALKAVRAVLYK